MAQPAKTCELLFRNFLRFGFSLLLALDVQSGLAADIGAVVDGKSVFDKSCAGCHRSGPGAFFSGAPKIGADAWKARLAAAGSADALAASAAKGKGRMPAQGGPSGLSDADLKAAVKYILDQTAQQ